MRYMLPRLRGWGESMSRQAVWPRRRQQRRRRHPRPRQTKIGTDRRRIRERMSRLRREIRDSKQVRDTQRSQRRSEVPIHRHRRLHQRRVSPACSARLTGAGVLVQNALFATWNPPPGAVVSSMTAARSFSPTRMGFVRHLPTQLVEAFRSTLERSSMPTLLVHVIDGSDVNPLAQIGRSAR